MLLVDTNVISELMRPRPNAHVKAWAELQTHFTLSVVTIEEIIFGLNHRPHAEIELRFFELLDENCEVLPVSRVIAQRAGELRGQFERQGKPKTQADMLIAGTALEHRLTLATRNVRGFAGCGVRLVNPFQP